MKRCLAFIICLLVLATALPAGAEEGGKVVFAGVRSSSYGIKPFPEPQGWEAAIRKMASYFEGAAPCAIWIVGVMAETPRFAHLDFPGDPARYPNIEFEAVDRHERFLSYFDKAGIKVFLQVEPANADVETLIDLVLSRYRHHPCVVGFGVDVEWNRVADKPGSGCEVDDATARKWEARIKSYDPKYRMFLKHWDVRWMPPTYRGDIVFVDDGQEFKSFDDMLDRFPNIWAKAFYPNTVVFQIGYDSDKAWWGPLPTPPRTMGEGLRKRVKQDIGVIWVDFSLKDVLPLQGTEDKEEKK